MVSGIKNSTHFAGARTISNTLKAKVIECPMVNAVIIQNMFFQSFITKTATKTNTKS